MNNTELALRGAFIYEGLNDSKALEADLDNIGGVIGLAEEACKYALDINTAVDNGYRTHGDCPGVFDYEVTSEFGRWFGTRSIQTGEVPPGMYCYAKIRELTEAFFKPHKHEVELTIKPKYGFNQELYYIRAGAVHRGIVREIKLTHLGEVWYTVGETLYSPSPWLAREICLFTTPEAAFATITSGE